MGKISFHGNRGYCLGTQISVAGLEVDQAKVSIIKTILPTTTFKGIRRFLGHVGFYRRLIKDFQKSLDHYVDGLKKMQSLILMKYAKLYLMKLNLD